MTMNLLRTLSMLIVACAPLWCGGSVVISTEEGDDHVFTENEAVTYTATWVADSNGSGPESYSWSITGDATAVGPTNKKSVTVKIMSSARGAKSFTATCTTTWDAPPEHTPKTASDSQDFTIIKLVQFVPKSGVFPKCINSSLSRDDFVVLTDPSGHEDKYAFSAPQGTTKAGTHKAEMSYRSDKETTDYEIVGSDTWVAIAGLPKPGLTGFTSTHVENRYIPPGLFTFGKDARMTITHHGAYQYDQIGSDVYAHNDSFTTTKAKGWVSSVSVAGETKVGLPFGFGEVKVTVTGSYGWQSSLSHSLTSNGGDAPYEYRAVHYQVITNNVKEDLYAETRIRVPNGPNPYKWQYDAGESYKNKSLGAAGANKFHRSKERKCPAN